MAQYIDKSVLVTEIERRIEAHKETLKNCDSSISEMVLKGSMSAYQSLLYFLDTLEVKEVDSEKEINNYVNEHFSECGDGVLISDANSLELTLFDIIPMAKHFFELGLKA